MMKPHLATEGNPRRTLVLDSEHVGPRPGFITHWPRGKSHFLLARPHFLTRKMEIITLTPSALQSSPENQTR